MVKILSIAVLIIFILIAIIPVSALDVSQGATVYIGDHNLNLTHALNQANGLTGADLDKIPVYTKIGWWASAATIFTKSPDKIIDLTGRYTDFTVESAEFGCAYNNYYLLDNTGTVLGTAFGTTNHNVFSVQGPATRPESSFTATKVGGAGSLTVQFTDTTSDNPAYWYWVFGDGTSSNLQNPIHTFSAVCNPQNSNGAYSVFLYTRDSLNNYNNCKEKTTPFTYSFPPQPTFSFTTNQTSGPAPLSIQFTDTSSNNPTGWSWNFQDGTTSTLQNPIHTFTISGVYYVTLRPSYPDVCTLSGSPATTTITVLSPLAPTTTTSATQTTATTTATTTAAPNTTVTTTVPTTTVTTTALTTASIVTTSATSIPSPTTKTTVKVTITKATPWPTDTMTQSTPLGIEIGIIATIGAVLLVMRRK